MEKVLNILLIFLIVLYKNIMYWPNMTNSILYGLIMIIMLLTFLSLLNKKINKNKFFVMTIITIIMAIAVFHTGSANLFFPVLILFAFYNFDNAYQKLSKYYFFSLLICFCSTILLNIIGILPSYNITRYYNIRYSLGYIHPGFVFLYFFFLFLSGYYYFKNTKKFILFTIPFAIIFYCLSLSRTGIICYFIFIFLVYYYQKRDVKKISNIVVYLFFILTAITIVSVKLYENYGLTQLDFLFSGRLFNYLYFIKNGLLTSPFGGINFGTTLYTIDNFFLVLFYDYGYVGYIIYGILSVIAIKKNINDKKFIICIFVFLIYGICDSNTIVSSINFLIPLQLMIIFNDKLIGRDDVEKN